VFIVTLLTTLLTALGIFASRAASLNEMAAGYDRLNEQTHYVLEHGVLLAATEIGQQPEGYLKVAKEGGVSNQCYSLSGLTNTTNYNYPCAKFTFSKLTGSSSYVGDVALAQQKAGFPTAPAISETNPPAGDPSGDASKNIPGSLGPVPLTPRFYIEMSDVGPAGRPPVGSAVAGSAGSQFGYLQVSLGAWGQVGPYIPTGVTSCSPTDVPYQSALLTSREAGRAQVVIGPVANSGPSF
jgi:hypothetical protein